MQTKLCKNVGGEATPYLVFHVSSELEFPNLEKFTGGPIETRNGLNLIATGQGGRSFDVGDYVIYVHTPGANTSVKVVLNKVKQYMPNGSYLILKPEKFKENFKEI